MSEPAKVYLTRAGKRGEDEEFALEHGAAVIGFQEVPSLEGAKDYDAVLKIVRDSLPTKKPRAIGNIAGQLWAFAVAMDKDDLVVLPRKLTSQVAIGRVKGPYRYQKVGDDLRHTRPVEWIRPDVPRTAFEQDLLHSFSVEDPAFQLMLGFVHEDFELAPNPPVHFAILGSRVEEDRDRDALRLRPYSVMPVFYPDRASTTTSPASGTCGLKSFGTSSGSCSGRRRRMSGCMRVSCR